MVEDTLLPYPEVGNSLMVHVHASDYQMGSLVSQQWIPFVFSLGSSMEHRRSTQQRKKSCWVRIRLIQTVLMPRIESWDRDFPWRSMASNCPMHGYKLVKNSNEGWVNKSWVYFKELN